MQLLSQIIDHKKTYYSKCHRHLLEKVVMKNPQSASIVTTLHAGRYFNDQLLISSRTF